MKLRPKIFLVLFVNCVVYHYVATAASAPSFTAAVISEEDTGLSDIFFSVLADSDNVKLVEREEFERLVQESGLTSVAGATPVKLGQITNADALVLVTKSDQRLFVRIVETLRGIRLFESVDAATPEGAKKLAQIVRKQLEQRSGLLATVPSNRRYVAIDPLVLKKIDKRNRYPEFSALGDLLAVELSSLPNVICVERQALEEVVFEKALDEKADKKALTWANWLLGGVCEISNGTQATVSLRLKSLLDGNTKYSPAFKIKMDDIDRGMQAMMNWIADTIDIKKNETGLTAGSGEAETQYLLGRSYGARGLRDRALRCFRVAHILDPENTQYTWELATGLVGSVGERTDRVSKMQEIIEAMDLCQYSLKKKKCCFNDSYLHNTYPWNAFPKFLQSVPKNLDEGDREIVTRFRKRLRNYMEWLYDYKTGSAPDKEFHWLQVMCPYFFSEPEPAMAYMRSLLKVGDFDWLRLSYSNFLAVAYWDRSRARELWERFLCDIRDTRDGAAKYYAMRSIAMLDGGYSKNPSPKGIQGVQELFKWLAANPKRYGYIRHYMSREVWAGFQLMDIGFQRRYLGPLMMPRVLRGGSEAAHEHVLQACDRVLAAYPDDPDVSEEIGRHLNAYLKKWTNGPSSFLHTKLVNLLENKYPKLLPLAAPELLKHREGITSYIDGLEPVFDYLEDVPAKYREGYRTDIGRYGICMDPPYIWITWFIYKDYKEDPKRKQARILFVQFDMRTRSSRVYSVPAAWGSCHKALVRWRNNLFLVAYSAVRIVPFDPVTEKLLVNKADTLKGLPPLGTQSEDVTCLVPGKDYIYIGTTPGILFRWKPGMKSAEQIARHDLLAPGPLNDTNPYTVTSGRYDEVSDSMEFHIKSDGVNPKSGWWRYKPGKKTPWKWIADNGPRTDPARPAWKINTYGGIVKHDLQFIPGKSKPIIAARATGNVRTAVKWCKEAAIWVVQSGHETFAGPMRMYMIERDDWPEMNRKKSK